jgi:hypothetical protein
MSKPLAGRRWFNAHGRRDYALGFPPPRHIGAWPSWAQSAYRAGRAEQSTIKWPSLDQLVRHGFQRGTP